MTAAALEMQQQQHQGLQQTSHCCLLMWQRWQQAPAGSVATAGASNSACPIFQLWLQTPGAAAVPRKASRAGGLGWSRPLQLLRLLQLLHEVLGSAASAVT